MANTKNPRILSKVNDTLKSNAGLCKLLGDHTRLRLCFLMAVNGPLNVGSLCEAVDQEQPNVSHHLGLLRSNGIVTSQRQGKNVFYNVASEAVGKLVLAFGEPAAPRKSRAPKVTKVPPAVEKKDRKSA